MHNACCMQIRHSPNAGDCGQHRSRRKGSQNMWATPTAPENKLRTQTRRLKLWNCASAAVISTLSTLWCASYGMPEGCQANEWLSRALHLRFLWSLPSTTLAAWEGEAEGGTTTGSTRGGIVSAKGYHRACIYWEKNRSRCWSGTTRV